MRSDGRAVLWLMSGLGAILLAASLSWFLKSFERRTQEIDTGYSTAARRNPLLAAERFLERLDIPVESRSGRELLRDLPGPDDILMVRGLGILNVERQDALNRWIAQGGRLIVEAEHLGEEGGSPARRGGDFLHRYGVRLKEDDERPNPFGSDEKLVAEVHVEGFPRVLKVAFAAGAYLEDADGEASGHVSAQDRARLLQYEIGDGLLTAVSDIRFATNRRIGDHDHALFLALLADPRDGGKVWLLYDSGMPWLGALLWRRAPMASVSSCGLLVLFLWYLGRRLGPLAPVPAGRRRDLLAHLQASADFLWRHGQGSRLTQASRERIEQAWLRRHPILREMDRAGRAAWIADRAGLAPAGVARTLYPAAVQEADLVADAVLLQRLWSSLSIPAATGPLPRVDALEREA